ncbi:MAG: ABC transporter permease, partial [Ardenticatenia bacterium]
LPTTWAMQAFQKVVAHGAGTRGVLPDIGILAGFAALFLLAGMRTFRNPI